MADKSLPYTYAKYVNALSYVGAPRDACIFLGSEMFTILAGPSLKTFHVHKQLLAELSPELKSHVFNEMKEGRENIMEMRDVSEETICQFLEFCYRGEYTEFINIDDEVENALDPGHYIRNTRVLIPNAKLYTLGDMYNVPRLKSLALENICAAIKRIEVRGLQQPHVARSYIELMVYSCANIPERMGKELDPLLAYLANCAVWGMEHFHHDEDFLELFSTGGRADFTRKFLGDLVSSGAGSMPPPWEPRINSRSYSPSYDSC